MTERTTERLAEHASGLDELPIPEIANRLYRSQRKALSVVEGALDRIVAAARLMGRSYGDGGNLAYVGAGTSGLMAMADALELPVTYGIPPERILILMAGGLPSGSEMSGLHDDDVAAAAAAGERIRPEDAVIAVSASGSTPYTCQVLQDAKASGCATVAIACNEGEKIFEWADVAICLPSPPELVAGSTRMGAGTAQKVALNMISTIVGIELGHVHDGMMVNFVADNAKLRARAVRTVAKITGADERNATRSLEESGWRVKEAVLLAHGISLKEAEAILDECGGRLKAALDRT